MATMAVDQDAAHAHLADQAEGNLHGLSVGVPTPPSGTAFDLNINQAYRDAL